MHDHPPTTTPPVSQHVPPASASGAATTALSAREAQAVALIVQGLSNGEIAASAFLSINSVKTYIRTASRSGSPDALRRGPGA